MHYYHLEKMFWLLEKNNERNKALDFWRAIAIILVLFRHAPISNDANFIFLILQKGGWVGVDIFFVLSGFLVSGLLFKEFKLKKHIDIKRFLIRRAFKIYPSFYLFSLLYLIYSAFFKQLYFNYNQITQLSDFVSIKKAVVFAKKRSSRALTRFEEPRSAISVQYLFTQQSLFLCIDWFLG